MGRAPDGPGVWLELLTGGDPVAIDHLYESARLAALRAIPGAGRVRRLRECDGGPRHAVIAEVNDVAAARRHLATGLDSAPPLESAGAAQWRGVLAGAVSDPAVGAGGVGEGPVVFAILMAVQPAIEEEYNRWYDAEHIPILLEHAGWLAARRYRCDSPVSEYLTLYQAAHPGIVTPQAREAVRRTEWSRRMLGGTFLTHTRAFLRDV